MPELKSRTRGVKGRDKNMMDVSGRESHPLKKRVNKQLVIKALVDPQFRKMLETDPRKAIGVRKLSKVNMVEIGFVLAAIRGIDRQILNLADELLCANNGEPCGIATV